MPRRSATELAKMPALRDLQYRPVARLPDDRSQRRPREGGPRRADAGRRRAVARRRPPRPAGSSCRTTGPIRRPASATRCRSKCRGPVVRTSTACRRSTRPTTWRRFRSSATATARCSSATSPSLQPGTMPGQFDRYNMKRQVTLTANIAGADLGTRRAARSPRPSSGPANRPTGVKVDIRGQIPPMNEMLERPGGRARRSRWSPCSCC